MKVGSPRLLVAVLSPGNLAANCGLFPNMVLGVCGLDALRKTD
jgi:hypothetical protein